MSDGELNREDVMREVKAMMPHVMQAKVELLTQIDSLPAYRLYQTGEGFRLYSEAKFDASGIVVHHKCGQCERIHTGILIPTYRVKDARKPFLDAEKYKGAIVCQGWPMLGSILDPFGISTAIILRNGRVETADSALSMLCIKNAPLSEDQKMNFMMAGVGPEFFGGSSWDEV